MLEKGGEQAGLVLIICWCRVVAKGSGRRLLQKPKGSGLDHVFILRVTMLLLQPLFQIDR